MEQTNGGFRIRGTEAFGARMDSLMACLDRENREEALPTDNELESDEEEVIDPMNTRTFQQERLGSQGWKFYSLKDVPDITEEDNHNAALSTQQTKEEYMLLDNVENLSLQDQEAGNTELCVHSLRKKIKKNFTLDDEGCEELTLNL